MHALMTTIAIQWQNVNMEYAFVKERQLGTGKTVEVRLLTRT